MPGHLDFEFQPVYSIENRSVPIFRDYHILIARARSDLIN